MLALKFIPQARESVYMLLEFKKLVKFTFVQLSSSSKIYLQPRLELPR
jgi:hypothetical protein